MWSVLLSIHSSVELKICIAWINHMLWPVGITDWGDVLFISLRIWHLWGSKIFGSMRLIKVIRICYQWDSSVIYDVVKICIQGVTRVNLAISIKVVPSLCIPCVDRNKQSFNKYIYMHLYIYIYIYVYMCVYQG